MEENVYCKNSNGEEYGVTLQKCQSLCLNLNYCVGVSFISNLDGGVDTECIFCSDENMLENKDYAFYRRPGNVQCNSDNDTQLYYDYYITVWLIRLRSFLI